MHFFETNHLRILNRYGIPVTATDAEVMGTLYVSGWDAPVVEQIAWTHSVRRWEHKTGHIF